MVSQLSVNQSPTSSHHFRLRIPASDASSILVLASRAASSRMVRASSAIFFAASRAFCAEDTSDWADVWADLACCASRVAARTLASSGFSVLLLPVGSSLYLSASLPALVTHESADERRDLAELRSVCAARPLASARSASACARSSFGQYAASASPAMSYDVFSFFNCFGTPEN